ncbi:MAG: fused MFS/spermidine synthase [Spirochaetota bacterium]
MLNVLFLLLFTTSGAAALIYEVVWVRQFTHLLGASSYAVTIILAAFMAGLCLGALIIGKKSDRCDEKRLFKTYVIIEVGIGVFALMLPIFLELAKSIYVSFYQVYSPGILIFNGFKLGIAFLLLVFPTVLIGATLPVMSRYIIRVKDRISVTVSRLYALNTIGGVLGAICAGYFFIPALGVRLTTQVAVGLNFFVAGSFYFINAVVISRKNRVYQTHVHINEADPASTPIQKSILAAFCISGIAAMFYEVAWTRTLSMILGTTTYAFTTMLATFLVGIALGSAVYNLIPRSFSRVSLFVLLQLVVAFSVLFTIPLFEKLPFMYLYLHRRWMNSWMDMQFMRFVMAALIMLVPTLALGTLLPTISSIFIEKTGHLGRRLGKAYSLNTLGNVMGAAAGGLILVPLIGMQKTIMVGAILNLAGGALILLFRKTTSPLRRSLEVACAGAGALFLIIVIGPWDSKIINSGVYVYASRYQKMLDEYNKISKKKESIPQATNSKLLEVAMRQYRLLYYDAGVASTVAVMQRDDGVKFLTIDGKTDASTGSKSDMRTQVMIGQLPMLFHENPDKVLVVGLGSGVTAGSVLTHDIRVVDCAEISPSVIEASRYFSDVNHNALDDPRMKIIPKDARNMLLTSEKMYDVVVSQPSNPWISGESELFSLEWYQQVSKHLYRNGLFLQWVPTYYISKQDLKIIINTLRSVFPHLTVWSSGSLGDLIFIAKKNSRLRIDLPALMEKLKNRKIRNDILRVGLDPSSLILDLFVMDEQDLTGYLYKGNGRPIPKNTDDRLITEFSTPKQLVRHKKVKRFLKPRHLHGDPDSLLRILKNTDRERINKLLIEKLG